jgi:hypothetical protein
MHTMLLAVSASRALFRRARRDTSNHSRCAGGSERTPLQVLPCRLVKRRHGALCGSAGCRVCWAEKGQAPGEVVRAGVDAG